MKCLVLKDLLLQRSMLFLAFVYVLLFTFAFQGMGEGQPIAIISAVCYMFVMMEGAWEEKNNSDVLWVSLPVPKWKIVGAKYLAIPLYVAIVVGIYLFISTLFFLLGISITATPLNSVGVIVGLLAVFTMGSVYYPVYFALGYRKSRYFHFILFFGIMTLASVLPRLFPQKPAWVDSIEVDLPVITSDTEVLVLLGTGIAVMVFFSFLLSLFLYRRREF